MHTKNRKMEQEEFLSKKWRHEQPPKRVLVIRLHAFGDVCITLPYIESLKEAWPQAQIDMLTREETAELPKQMKSIGRVYSLDNGRSNRKLWLKTALLAPTLLFNRYDIVIDLQRSRMTRWIRRLLAPTAFSEFDRYSHQYAGERTVQTINKLTTKLSIKATPLKLRIAPKYPEGLAIDKNIVVLNPAGLWPSRRWDWNKYLEFAKHWLTALPNTQFVFLGIGEMAEKARRFAESYPLQTLDLAGKTTVLEAYATLQRASVLITEDSGLLHLAHTACTPMVVLTGSSPSYWIVPKSDRVISLDSSGLSCANCFKPDCQWGDMRCLNRFSGKEVAQLALTLYKQSGDPIQ